jgi:cytochrome c peroxidase
MIGGEAMHDLDKGTWLGLALMAAAIGALSAEARDALAEDALLQRAHQAFKPLPKDMATPGHPVTPARVKLGRALFFDPRLSADGTVSCARCHQPALCATDALPRSLGVGDKPNPRNAPTVLNAALQFREHWVGDRADVEDQAQKSLIGPASFGNPDYPSVVAKLKSLGYERAFRAAFPGDPEPVRPENWGAAIGAYERTLVTPSPFDRYLQGDTGALSPEAQKGLETFLNLGCSRCHNGVGVGGGSFQKFGLTGDYWKETGSREVDLGRYKVTHAEGDRYVFKVPSLRNVAMTPPYFHDGSVAALPQAVRIMAKLQLGRTLSDEEVRAIVTFLASLTGELPADFTSAPVLAPAAFVPPSAAATPPPPLR